jgi:hypothetical protein
LDFFDLLFLYDGNGQSEHRAFPPSRLAGASLVQEQGKQRTAR